MAKIVLALATVYLVWGSTFLAVKIALTSFPALTMTGLRFLLAGLLVQLYCWKRYPAATLAQWASALLSGWLMLGLGTGMVAWAEQSCTSAQAAAMNATIPIWVALGTACLTRRLEPLKAVGILISSLGVLVLVGDLGRSSWALLALLGASLSWTVGTLLMQKLPCPESSLQFSGMTMLGAAPFLLALGSFSGESLNGPVTGAAVLAWLYLVVAGSLLAMTAYTWLLRRTSATLAATHTYVNPLVATGLSALVGEPVPPGFGLAVLLVVLGLISISLSPVLAQGPARR